MMPRPELAPRSYLMWVIPRPLFPPNDRAASLFVRLVPTPTSFLATTTKQPSSQANGWTNIATPLDRLSGHAAELIHH
jgi:hypothetical protein